MTKKIDKKITGYKVLADNSREELPGSENATTAITTDTAPALKLEILHEDMIRPGLLLGATYKIKTPQSDHALYITINDIVLNAGTPHEERRAYEIFINSKNMEHFQWVLALTRVISGVFRKGGDATFLVEELKSVFDPKGGYFKKGGVFMPSLVAEIGYAIESHMKAIGMIVETEMDEHQKKFLAAKRQEFEARHSNKTDVNDGHSDSEGDDAFPKKATLCSKCQTKAAILMDGCSTCLNCGESKCY